MLAAAWTDYGKSNPPSDDKAFLDGWMKARATALAKANMPNGFEITPAVALRPNRNTSTGEA